MYKLSGNALSGFSLLFIALSLAACGGGSSSSDGGSGSSSSGSDPITGGTAVKPGIFVTTVTPGSGAPDQEALTLLSSSGKYVIFTTNTPTGTIGTLTFRNDDTFSDDDGTYVFFDETWQSFDGSLEGSAISSEEFTATFTADTAEPDVGSDITGIRFNELSDLPVTIQDLYATYSLPDSAMTVTIEPDGPDGKVTGSTNDGCVINGDISIPDPAYNIFEGNLLFENCPDAGVVSSNQRNGDYPIIGYLLLLSEGGKRLVFAGTNGEVMSLFNGTN